MIEKSLKVIGSFAAGFSGMVYLLPNTVFLDNLQKIYQLYYNAEPVPVSLKVKSLMEEVLNDMKIVPEDKNKILLFTCYGFENFYAGSIWRNKFLGNFKKALIGIPEIQGLEKLTRKGKDEIQIKEKKLNWSSEAGELLENSLLLSDKGKKFALAQQVVNVSRCDPVVKCIALSLSCSVAFFVARNINNIKKFQPKQFQLIRYGLISFSLVFNYSFWITFKDIYTCSSERETDKRVAELGKEYIEGGLEYFSKLLNKNIAIRTLQEEEGEKTYFSLFGNEELMFRQKHLPLTTRRDYFKQLLDE